jgi:ATP-dependent DNA helicase RecG
VRYIKGVGESRAKLMEKLGIHTLRDLISAFPRDYEDRTSFKTIGELTDGETAGVNALAATAPRLAHIRRGLDMTKLRAADDTGALEITFFNQSFMKDAIKPGETYIFYGTAKKNGRRIEMANPIVEKERDRGSQTGRLVPIYDLTAGLTQRMLMSAVRQGLDICGDILPDVLPTAVRERYQLAAANFAYENIHFPADFTALELARRRLIFEELFVLSTAMRVLRAGRGKKSGRRLEAHDFSEFFAALPFALTNAQKRAIGDAARDMAGDAPMCRLVQGDVGSGKTVVAAALCWLTWKNGCQSAFMAPTEILAEQHYRTFSGLLAPLGLRVGLLTGGMKAKERRDALSHLALGETDVVIGTHALISEDVAFRDLALAVTDEQHRFGVNQRALLTAKGVSPHVLVMSATPIPRTLSLIIYGDMDVSVIDELPPGRRAIETFAVGESYRARINKFIRKLAEEGRQVYVVCPAVEESETLDLKSARENAEKLQTEVFPDLRVALVHGGMKSKEKDGVMAAFARGESDILVATTVIEVGVDVPNAALIVVENADRFGLSQLHQLRGRVGRGERQSYCVLFEGAGGGVSKERLAVLCGTNDGFKISEEDLKLRGPGDFFGARQHGLPQLRIASLANNMEALKLSLQAAEELLADDPTLEKHEHAALAARVRELVAEGENMIS